MANKFKPGEVVVLKSGGPKMTVNHIESTGHIWTDWFAGAKHERARFTPE